MIQPRKIIFWFFISFFLAAGSSSRSEDAHATFRVGGFSFSRPAKWLWVEVTSAMRKAQLSITDEKSKASAEVVFFAGIGGGAQANVDRWFGQFEGPREKINAKTQEVKVGKHKILYASAQGTYLSGMPGAAKTPMKDYALLAAIIESPQGDIFIRMTGPAELVKRSTEEFKKMTEAGLK